MRTRVGQGLAGGWSLVMLGWLWAPLLVVVVYSFNTSRLGAQWGGFTMEWYRALAKNGPALAAARNSVLLAVVSTLVATSLGTLLGYGLGRFRFRRRRSVELMIRLPMVIPDVVGAVALVLVFSLLRRWTGFLELGLGTMILGHVSFQIPFVALVVQARTAGFNSALEEAARDLGATPWRAFWGVTFPWLRPGILAGALLAFTLSLDDFAFSFFTAGPGSTTLPVFIYASARRGITPDLNALSTLLTLLTLVLVALGAWGRGVRR